MRRIVFLYLVAAAWSVFLVAPASAVTIGFSPVSQTVAEGDPVVVDLVISDLGGEIVSAYDLDVTYDGAVLSAVSVSFGPLLGNEALFEVFSDSDLSTPGVVDLAQLSLLSDAALFGLQGGDSFVLATLAFDVVAAGTSVLDFDWEGANVVVGRNAQVLDVDGIAGSVTAAPVPEPSAALLFAVGGIVVGGAMRRGRDLHR